MVIGVLLSTLQKDANMAIKTKVNLNKTKRKEEFDKDAMHYYTKGVNIHVKNPKPSKNLRKQTQCSVLNII